MERQIKIGLPMGGKEKIRKRGESKGVFREGKGEKVRRGNEMSPQVFEDPLTFQAFPPYLITTNLGPTRI